MQNINQILAYAYANLAKTDLINSVEFIDNEEDLFVNNQMRTLKLCPNCSSRKLRRKDKVQYYLFISYYYFNSFIYFFLFSLCVVMVIFLLLI